MGKKGFTIVELLIVIVVIAILAAITIVAYNGIQNRAKDTSLQTAASQAGKKVLAFGPTNSDLYPEESVFASPANLAASPLNLPAPSDAATYDYYTSNDRKSFCLSVTNTTTNPATSYAFTQNGQAVQGRCVKNIVTNPSLESTAAPYGSVNGATSTRQTASSLVGANGMNVSCPANNIADCGLNLAGTAQVTSGKVYTYSYLIRGVTAGSYNSYLGSNAGATASRPIVTLTSGQLGRISLTQTATGTGGIIWYALRGNGASVSTFDLDGIMVTEGSNLYTYADPATSPETWSWTGAAHASPSFGPAILSS